MMLFLSVLSIICVTSWVVYQGRFDSLGMIVFGVAFIFWNSLIITVLWELWHQKVMIREGGSWYAVNPGMMDNGEKGESYDEEICRSNTKMSGMVSAYERSIRS